MTKGEKGLIYPIYRGIIKTELWAKNQVVHPVMKMLFVSLVKA